MSDRPPLTIPTPDRVSTGINGFDTVLGGGLPAGQLYLLEGESGAGKTTFGLQFLMEGKIRGETTLWISLSETEPQLRQIAASHGWSIEGVHVANPTSPARELNPDEKYSFFSPGDIELDDIRTKIVKTIGEVRPARVVFDPFSDIRHLARDVLRYRREVLALRELFGEHGCTVLLMQEMTRGVPGDVQAEALVHGYVTLHQDSPEYGGQRRRIRVHKMRGIPFRDGYHDCAIQTGGLEVYPRLIAAEHEESGPEELVSSGDAAIDALLGGGVPRGSSLLIMGAAGVGKTILATQYGVAASRRGENVAAFVFDETSRSFRTRSAGIGLDIRPFAADKAFVLRQIDTAEMSPGQFTDVVMRAVEADGASMVIIDSLSGYMNAMPEERFLKTHLHELLTYLSHRNVLTVVTMAQHGVVGERVTSPADVSYLADTVILLRYFEASGAVRRAISVVKKRSGAHEVYVREMRISDAGVHIGDPLRDFHGVLSGRPEFNGSSQELAKEP